MVGNLSYLTGDERREMEERARLRLIGQGAVQEDFPGFVRLDKDGTIFNYVLDGFGGYKVRGQILLKDSSRR